MKKTISFNDGIIVGDDMRLLDSVLYESIHIHFKQRKDYDEYCFQSFKYDFSIEEFEALSNVFILEVSCDSIVIKV